MDEEASSVPRRLTRRTSGPLFSLPVGSGFLLNIQAQIPTTTIIPTTIREATAITHPRRREGTLGGSPPTHLVEEAGPRREARGDGSLRRSEEPCSATNVSQDGCSSVSAGGLTGVGARGAGPFRVTGRLAGVAGTAAGPLTVGATRTCGATGTRGTGTGEEAGARWSLKSHGSGRRRGNLAHFTGRRCAGGLTCEGTLGGVGVVVWETCQTLRGEDEEGSPLLGGVFGPPEDVYSPGVVPIAAGLSCGISLSGGGGIGVCVHGVSASATACGV